MSLSPDCGATSCASTAYYWTTYVQHQRANKKPSLLVRIRCPNYLQKLHDHAVSHPNTPAAIDALVVACRISSDTRPKSMAVLRKILSLLESEYLEDKRMSDVASALVLGPAAGICPATVAQRSRAISTR